MKKLALATFLAMPGSFVVLAVLCLHPRARAEIVDAAGLNSLFAALNRHAILLLLVVGLCVNAQIDERTN